MGVKSRPRNKNGRKNAIPNAHAHDEVRSIEQIRKARQHKVIKNSLKGKNQSRGKGKMKGQDLAEAVKGKGRGQQSNKRRPKR